MTQVKKTKSTPRKRAVQRRKKPAVLLDAGSLGIASEQLVDQDGIKPALFSPVPKAEDVPPANLPVAPFEEKPLFHRPLVSGRTSFWLGVGFGMFVVGVLTFVAWKLLTVEAVQALW